MNADADDATGPLQEVVVTATRHEEGLSEVLISVTALTQDAIDVRGVKDFQDVARFTPIIDGVLGVRATVWYRRDGGFIDRIDPVTLGTTQKNANFDQTTLIRLAAVWAPSEDWTVTPAYFYQDRYRNDVENYWPLYSNPGSDRFVSANPTQRSDPDRFYLPSLKIEGNLGWAKLISNTTYFHREEETGYDGTLFNLGFYQSFFGPGFSQVNPLLQLEPTDLPRADPRPVAE